jgi:signal transduction histidine kinase
MHLVDAAISEFASTLKEKGLTLEVKAPDVETIIYGDMLRLGQVLRNLLSNAIKFSGQGKVITIDFGRSIVSVSGREVPALKIRVTDQGTGIPAAERELIFDKFVQGTSTHDGAGGTGLGLAISLEIVRAHHGRIWANANPDGPGTRLVVVLPIDPPEPQPTASSPEENGRELDASLTNHDRG